MEYSLWVHKLGCIRVLTNEVEEGEADKEVGRPVEAAAEGEGSPSNLHWVNLTEDQPGHWGESKRVSGHS